MALTDLEKKVLKIVSSEAGRRLTVEELADRVGCQASTVYKRLQNKEFRDLFMEAMRNSIAASVPEVMNAFIDRAKTGSFKHGKLILEVSGIYEETKNIKADVGMSEESPFKDDNETKDFLKKTLSAALSDEVSKAKTEGADD